LNNVGLIREDGSWSSLLGSEFPTCEERGCFYSEASNPEIGDIEINGIKLAFG